MVDRVLVALDGSERAEAILAQVGTLLQREDPDIIVTRVVHVPHSMARLDTTALLSGERRKADEYLQRLKERLSAQGVRVTTRRSEGEPAEEILSTARKERATLIAMSTHGFKGLARWVMGSVAEKVVRASPIPVLLMRTFKGNYEGADMWAAREQSFSRILVTVDGSEESLAVIPPVQRLATLFEAEIVVLNVEQPAHVPAEAFTGIPGSQLPPPNVPAVPDDGPERARETVNRLQEAGIPATCQAAKGEPAAAILDAAETGGFGLLAMATHGYSGMTRWMLGSTTEKVLRSSTLPMLVVRSRPREVTDA